MENSNSIEFIDEFINIMYEIESELDGGNEFEDDTIPLCLWDLRDKAIAIRAMIASAQEEAK